MAAREVVARKEIVDDLASEGIIVILCKKRRGREQERLGKGGMTRGDTISTRAELLSTW